MSHDPRWYCMLHIFGFLVKFSMLYVAPLIGLVIICVFQCASRTFLCRSPFGFRVLGLVLGVCFGFGFVFGFRVWVRLGSCLGSLGQWFRDGGRHTC